MNRFIIASREHGENHELLRCFHTASAKSGLMAGTLRMADLWPIPDIASAGMVWQLPSSMRVKPTTAKAPREHR